MENPVCNFCGSDFPNHTTIYVNVKNTNHNLVECNNCHLRFYSPRKPFEEYLNNGYDKGYGQNKAAEEEANRMYNNGSFSIVKNPETQKKNLQSYYNNTVISKLFKLNPQAKICYEIGGSVGWMAHFLKQTCPDIIIDGCELNHYAVKIANENFKLNYTAGIFNDVSIKENYYDVIFALDYIEHTFTPYDDLRKCHAMLKNNGLIFLKTFLEELDINRTMEAPIGHSHHFFGYVLRDMLIKCGFEILELIEEIENVQVIIIAKKS